jgi:phosphatidylinositol-3-phosphatase
MLRTLVAGVVAFALCGGAAGGAGMPAAAPSFDHVIVVVFENKEVPDVVGSAEAPTFAALGRSYARLTGYYGLAHPSLPNYLALVSGSTHGITDDCTACSVDAPNLADTIEASGRTWKTYAEGLPWAGFTGGEAGRYAKKHNPFLYFDDVATDPARRARIVPFSRFARDLSAAALPNFALVVPDLCHDMHDCSVETGDRWLASFARPLLRLPGTVVFVVFDEGSSDARGGGHVPALVLGSLVRPHSRNGAPLDHTSLLRTIEDAWGLSRLGRSRAATPITGIWR